MKKILLVGAGAVGQVYGYHLQQAGAEVTFFVREKYLEELQQGMILYPLNRSKKLQTQPVLFKDFGLVSNLDEVQSQTWDLVILCISSTALRSSFLDDFLQEVKPAYLLSLQPGIEDKAYILERYDAAKYMQAIITLQSYHAPMEESETYPEKGVAYWFPPLSPQPISGADKEAVKRLVSLFRQGKQPSKYHKDVGQIAGFPSGIMMPMLTALEAEGWSFAKLKRSPLLLTATIAAKEIMQVVSNHNKQKLPFYRHFVKPFLFRFILTFSRFVMPFSLETFLRVHFSKVGDQTRFMMDDYIGKGKKFGLPIEHAEQLEKKLEKRLAESQA